MIAFRKKFSYTVIRYLHWSIQKPLLSYRESVASAESSLNNGKNTIIKINKEIIDMGIQAGLIIVCLQHCSLSSWKKKEINTERKVVQIRLFKWKTVINEDYLSKLMVVKRFFFVSTDHLNNNIKFMDSKWTLRLSFSEILKY